jgi:hypothetical protein
MDVSRILFVVYGLLALIGIGTVARWTVLAFHRWLPAHCPHCHREARWLGCLDTPERRAECLDCPACGIVFSGAEGQEVVV